MNSHAIMSAAYTKWLDDPDTIKPDILFNLLTENATAEETVTLAESFLPDLYKRYCGLWDYTYRPAYWSEGAFHYLSVPWKGTTSDLTYPVWRILDFVVPLLTQLMHKNVSTPDIWRNVNRFTRRTHRCCETDYYYNMLDKIALSPTSEEERNDKNNAIKKLLANNRHRPARGFVAFYDFFSKEYRSKVNKPAENYATNILGQHVSALSNLYELMPENLFPFLTSLVAKQPQRLEQFFNAWHLIKNRYFPMLRMQLLRTDIKKWEDLLLLMSLYFRFYELPRFKSCNPILDYTVEYDDTIKRLESEFWLDWFIKEYNKTVPDYAKDALMEKYTIILKNPSLLSVFDKKKKEAQKPLLPSYWERFATLDRKNAKGACLSGAICGMFYPGKQIPIDAGKEIARHLDYKTEQPLALVNRSANQHADKAFNESCSSAIEALTRRSFK